MKKTNNEILKMAAAKIFASWHKLPEEEFTQELLVQSVLAITSDIVSKEPKGFNEKFLLSLNGYLLALDKIELANISVESLYKTLINFEDNLTPSVVH